MKLRHSLSIFGLVAMLGLGVGVGLANGQKPIAEAKADPVTYYLRGTMNDWGTGTETLLNNGTPKNFTFDTADEFKFSSIADDWADHHNLIAGNAASAGLITGGGLGETNIRCEIGGTYSLSLTGNTITFTYVSGANLYYCGSDPLKSSDGETPWTDYTAKPIEIGGDPVALPFTRGETFKLRKLGTWDFELKINNVEDVYWDPDANEGSGDNYAYYKCFSGSSNIYVRYTDTYNVSLVFVGGNIKIRFANTGESNTAYALDLYGDKLPTKVHNFHKYLVDAKYWEIGTTWPGTNFSTQTNRIYTYLYWNVFDKVVFDSDGGTYKTNDLAVVADKCFVIGNTVDSKWAGAGTDDAHSWISLEAAQFIDGYMKFNKYDENTYNDEETGVTVNCDANWTAARDAYNLLASDAVRLEVLSIVVVKARLGKWAAAHGVLLSDSGATIATRAPITIANGIQQSGTNTTLIIAIAISSIAVLALIGGYFYFRKRKEDR